MMAQPRQPAASGDTKKPGASTSPARRRQPPHDPSELHFAKRTLHKLVQDSRFFPVHDADNRVKNVHESELDVGFLIGKGGFCEVRRASLRRHPGHRYAMKYLSPTKTAASRVFQRGIADLAMEACFLSLLQHDHIIGLHYVAEGSLEENYDCAQAAPERDAAGTKRDEVGVDANGRLVLRRKAPERPQTHVYGYFLLLDPLHETLTDRIEKTYIPQAYLDTGNAAVTTSSAAHPYNLWDRIRHKNTLGGSGNAGRLSDPNDPRVQLAQRLDILKCVASALRYLHEECHIIFRDIKPDNIGFYRRYRPSCSCGYARNQQLYGSNNQAGRIPNECTCYDEVTKLFDFGLAKELKLKYRKSHPAYPDQETYKLTGCTGSRRYMSPEVCFADPYNQRADVYSFGILLYQTSSLVVPFEGFSMGRHEREVLKGGCRPDVTIPNASSSSSNFFGRKRSSSQEHELPAAKGETDAEAKNRLLALRTKRHWPVELPRLMAECWDYDMRYRPEMRDVFLKLGSCIDNLLGGKGGVAAMRGGGMTGTAAGGAAAAHLPQFQPQAGGLRDRGGLALAAKAEHDVSTMTMETSPTSSHSFPHGSGFLDGIHLPFGNNPQQQYAFARSQMQHQQMQHQQMQHQQLHQQQLQYQHLYQYPHATTAVNISTISNHNERRRGDGYEADASNANFNNRAAAHRQQRKRSSSNLEGDEPARMQWR